MPEPKRYTLDLLKSIDTKSVDEEVFAFDDPEAEHIQNTGIERGGGISSIYEKETTFPTAGNKSIITTSGSVLQVDASDNVRLDDVAIGNVGPCSIYKRGSLPQYQDIAWTADDTILGLQRSGNDIIIDEYDHINDVILHTRTVTFAGMPAEAIRDIKFIGYVDMHYVDAQEILLVGIASSYWLQETGTSVTTMFTFVDFVWKFGTDKYIVGTQGKTGVWYIWIPSTGSTLYSYVKWAIIDIFPGTAYSRAILTFDPYKNAANLFTGYAYVGYTGAGVWNAVPTCQGIALGAVTAVVTNPITGPGYSECTFTRSDTGATIYFYAAPDQAQSGVAYYWSLTSNTHTPINGCGHLSQIYENNSRLTNIRLCLVGGISSYLSIAPQTVSYYKIGIPLTNVGEIDIYYVPRLIDDGSAYSRIIYRLAGTSYYIDVRSGEGHRIYKINDNVYLVDCISAINIVDVDKKILTVGINDYNGRLVFSNGAIVATHKVVATLKSPYANSIDTGDRLETNTIASLTTMTLLAVDLPDFLTHNVKYEINIFFDDIYAATAFAYGTGSTFKVLEEYKDLLYLTDTRLPVAMGYAYGEKTAATDFSTIFMGVGVTGQTDVNYGYAGYELGNQTIGSFISFGLYGQRYLFDGMNIYIATFEGPVFTNKIITCPANGMQLVAVSPTQVYFLSIFDNSIYVFDGGRTLTKYQRMNNVEAIIDGVFSVRDNTLLMQTANTFLWVRDGIVTKNAKKATQTAINLYDTTAGIVIANDTKSWRYPYVTEAGAVIVPLSWQSAYYGIPGNQKTIFTEWLITIFNEGKTLTVLTFTCRAFDTERIVSETRQVTIQPTDWTGIGFTRVRVRPPTAKCLAQSIQIDTPSHILIEDVVAEITEEAKGLTPSARSA